MDCIFCKIVAGDVPCYQVAESESALAFLDIQPIARGHALVIPRQHIPLFYDADPACMAAVMELATIVSAAINASVNCGGMNLVMNAGAVAGQVVQHAHLHIIPRWSDDGIDWPWPQGELTETVACELIDRIRRHLQ